MKNIYEALNEVMKDVGAVGKEQRNTHQNFNFRGIDAVINAVSPAFRKHGIFCTPTVLSSEYESVQVGQNRTTMGHARVTVQYTFHAFDGTSVTATVSAESMDSGDKATAKAMSVAYRTALLQTLCLPTDDTDPDAETFERSPASSEPARPPAGSYARKETSSAPSAPKAPRKPAEGKPAGNEQVSQAQLDFLEKLRVKTELSRDDLTELATKSVSTMTSAEASAIINDLLAVTKDAAEFTFVDGKVSITHKEQ
jgi:hypothetical protein